jgi:hypothetical protein
MKHRLAVFALVLAIFAGGEMADFEKKAHADSAFSFSLFYNSLSPYGSWVPVNGYGYGWYPAQAGPGWQPYQDGQWVWSDQGWTWISAEPWGWATYHYGRWVFDSYYGWTWIPGTTWAPAYVSWYQSPGYVGWSPLPPDNNFFLEIGISFVDYNYGYNGGYYGGYDGYYGGNNGHHHKHKKGHYYDNDYYAPGDHCVFVPEDKFNNHNAKLVALDGEKNLTVMRNVKNVTNIKTENNKIYNYGPDKSVIERAVKGKLEPVKLVDTDLSTLRAGRNIDKNNYKVFRPSIEKKPDETPFNSGSSVLRGVKDTNVNKDTGIKNGFNAQDRNNGNGLVQQRTLNTGKNKPYGNAEPDGYGVISKDPGKLKSDPGYDTRNRGQIGADTNIPVGKPAINDVKPSTATTRKNNNYYGPSTYDSQNRARTNASVNDGLRKQKAPAAEQKPINRNPYNYGSNNNGATNRYPNPGTKQAYQRAPVQPKKNNYNPNGYGSNSYKMQKPAAQYRQPSQKQSNVSTNRKPSGSDNNRSMNTAPRQYTSPSMNTGTRNFNSGNTRSYNNGSIVKNR